MVREDHPPAHHQSKEQNMAKLKIRQLAELQAITYEPAAANEVVA